MNKIKRLNKKSLYFLILLLIIGVVGGTIAYYTTEDVFLNQLKTMTYNVVIEEEFDGTWGTKKVSFVNKEDTNMPVVLRFNYNEMWTKEENGITKRLSNVISDNNVVNKIWTLDFEDYFYNCGDGWFYYTRLLKANESIQVLESINLDDELISSEPNYQDYLEYDYELDFQFEAIQANSDAILEIWNMHSNIVGDEISWGVS